MGNYKKIAGVYSIKNVVNGKRYIGHSINIKKRWAQHRDVLRRGTCHCIHLQSAWNKYGEEAFSFSILEELPFGLNKKEYEQVETKWVLHFNTHLNVFGYNSVLPGNFISYIEDSNRTRAKKILYVCINIKTSEIVECEGPQEIIKLTGISPSRIGEISKYWDRLDVHIKRVKKSSKGWIVVRKGDYNSEFDYIGYKKTRPSDPNNNWRKYYNKEEHRKNPEDIIPREQRNLKRISIIAENVSTGEEKKYKMLKDCYEEFDKMKVYKCINNPFKKYKHRGYYFRRVEEVGVK